VVPAYIQAPNRTCVVILRRGFPARSEVENLLKGISEVLQHYSLLHLFGVKSINHMRQRQLLCISSVLGVQSRSLGLQSLFSSEVIYTEMYTFFSVWSDVSLNG